MGPLEQALLQRLKGGQRVPFGELAALPVETSLTVTELKKFLQALQVPFPAKATKSQLASLYYDGISHVNSPRERENVGQHKREFDGVKDSVAASSAAVVVADDFEQMKVADLKKFLSANAISMPKKCLKKDLVTLCRTVVPLSTVQSPKPPTPATVFGQTGQHTVIRGRSGIPAYRKEQQQQQPNIFSPTSIATAPAPSPFTVPSSAKSTVTTYRKRGILIDSGTPRDKKIPDSDVESQSESESESEYAIGLLQRMQSKLPVSFSELSRIDADLLSNATLRQFLRTMHANNTVADEPNEHENAASSFRRMGRVQLLEAFRDAISTVVSPIPRSASLHRKEKENDSQRRGSSSRLSPSPSPLNRRPLSLPLARESEVARAKQTTPLPPRHMPLSEVGKVVTQQQGTLLVGVGVLLLVVVGWWLFLLTATALPYCDTGAVSVEGGGDCQPCPARGRCVEGQLTCEHGYRVSREGCVRDTAYEADVEALEEWLVHFVSQQLGDVNCGLLPPGSERMEVDTVIRRMQTQFSAMRKFTIKWGDARRRLESSDLPRVQFIYPTIGQPELMVALQPVDRSFYCWIRGQFQAWCEQYLYDIVLYAALLLLSMGLLTYSWMRITKWYRWSADTKGLGEKALRSLRANPHMKFCSVHLRENLMEQLGYSAEERGTIWKVVEAKVDEDARVDSHEEWVDDTLHKVWRWKAGPM